MNNHRRKQIQEAMTHLSDALNLVQEAGEEEQEAFDNLPEGIKEGERGEAMEAAISCLDDAAGAIEEAESQLEDAI